MLTEERFNKILKIIDEKKSVTVQELTELLNSSESTIRRDLNALHKLGKLIKVHGGATAIDMDYNTKDFEVSVRYDLNKEQKKKIGAYAASLIEENDFIYIDAGTTTEFMIDYITEKSAVFVTNAITHAVKLSNRGFKVFVTGGEFKNTTEALIGNETVENLKKYNFTKGFFGANGVSKRANLSTPDVTEALTKKGALAQCRKSYILCDSSKFGKISSVTFGKLSEAIIITDKLTDEDIRKETEVVEVIWYDLYCYF